MKSRNQQEAIEEAKREAARLQAELIEANKQLLELRERSEFVREDGRWLYTRGVVR